MPGMRFTKMHGAGNDFLLFEEDEVRDMDLSALARRACDRHFGVGADGILLPAASERADVRMIYYNSDGSLSRMCGNGIRCLARYAVDHGLVSGETLTIETGAGVHTLCLNGDGSSRVGMGEAGIEPEIEVCGRRFLRVDLGNPHAVAFLEDEEEVEALDLRSLGPVVEHDPAFPEKTNVEFAFSRGPHEVRMRIWERGAGETLASGSGACATAAAALHHGLASSPVAILLDGGVVEVEEYENQLYMTGPAEYVCEGRLF